MVTKRCRQGNLHEMSYTIKYSVKTRMATGVAVSTERVKLLSSDEVDKVLPTGYLRLYLITIAMYATICCYAFVVTT